MFLLAKVYVSYFHSPIFKTTTFLFFFVYFLYSTFWKIRKLIIATTTEEVAVEKYKVHHRESDLIYPKHQKFQKLHFYFLPLVNFKAECEK